ncbi:MAG: hypothetical protein ACYCUF_00655 [Acidimicrobiales bacterium]
MTPRTSRPNARQASRRKAQASPAPPETSAPGAPGGAGGAGGAGTIGESASPWPDALSARWRGQAGRLEVWYATVSDPLTKSGLWVHHEVVAPDEGEPYVHGWAAIFRAGKQPQLERMAPEPLPAARPATTLPAPRGSALGPLDVTGRAGKLSWDVRLDADATQAPLFTFPAWAWEREALPGAQVLPVPSAACTGTLGAGPEKVELSPQARGNLAHIYGRGSAERWGWLHAELGGGDVLEIVAATSRHAGLDRLPPMPFVQLRLGGHDWPRDPLVAAPLMRCRLGLPDWEVRGSVGRWRIRVSVTIPEESSVAVGYVDPDGSTATCTNSEIADAEIVLEHRRSRWETEHVWTLHHSAHAEVGTRP